MLDLLDHHFGRVAMFAQDEMDVIRHDRQRVTGVAVLSNGGIQGMRYEGPLIGVKWQQIVFERRGGLLIERTNLPRCRLHPLAPMMQVAQIAKKIIADDLGC